MKNTEKALKAYSVQDEEHGVVVFASSGIAARRMGANELNTEFECIESCRRLPWADEYASAGTVPPLVLIDHGWWFECSHCGVKVCSDSSTYDKESDKDIPHEPVADGDFIYCCPAHLEAELKKRSELAARKDAAKQAAQQQFPGVKVSWVSENDPATVCFIFPGGNHPAHWTVGSDTVRVCQIDVGPWEAFKADLGASA